MSQIKSIKLKGVMSEDFANYSKPSLFLVTSYCDFKCCHEAHIDESICQNQSLVQQPIKEFSFESVYNAYMKNDITNAVVLGGLEPFMQYEEILGLVGYFRDNGCQDTIIIYTGYKKDELSDKIEELAKYPNIIVKYGRFVPNETPHFDNILGIYLASNNQYAEKIS